MNAAVGGIVAAVTWGSADFIARFTGGAVGYAKALFGMLAASAVVLTALVLFMALPIAELSAAWWLLLLAGAGLTLATMFLYQGLVRGPVTVVAPIAGTFPAFNIVLALALGVRPSLLEWAAMAAVMASRSRRDTTRHVVTTRARTSECRSSFLSRRRSCLPSPWPPSRRPVPSTARSRRYFSPAG
jgi:uncharacterized membrane protein